MNDKYIVAVTGGRNYDDWSRVRDEMDDLLEKTVASGKKLRVVHGGATGLDALVDSWCKLRGVEHQEYPADWGNLSHEDALIRQGRRGPYDARAGMRRNQEILDKENPDLLKAFPGGAGTAGMTREAVKRSIRVEFVR